MKARLFAALAVATGLAAIVTRHPLAVAAAGLGTSFWLAQADLSVIRGFPGALIVRRVFRVWFPVGWLALLPMPPLAPTWGALAAVVLVLLLMLPSWRDIRDLLDPAMLDLLPPVSGQQKFRDAFALATVGVAQELVFRYLVLLALSPVSDVLAVLVSSVLFAAVHAVASDWRDRWDRRDLVIHGVMGAGLAVVTLATHSLFGAIVAHTLYNAPALWQILRQPSRSATETDQVSAGEPTEKGSIR